MALVRLHSEHFARQAATRMGAWSLPAQIAAGIDTFPFTTQPGAMRRSEPYSAVGLHSTGRRGSPGFFPETRPQALAHHRHFRRRLCATRMRHAVAAQDGRLRRLTTEELEELNGSRRAGQFAARFSWAMRFAAW